MAFPGTIPLPSGSLPPVTVPGRLPPGVGVPLATTREDSQRVLRSLAAGLQDDSIRVLTQGEPVGTPGGDVELREGGSCDNPVANRGGVDATGKPDTRKADDQSRRLRSCTR